MSNPDGVARQCSLPNPEFAPAWDLIMPADGIRERLLARCKKSVRQPSALTHFFFVKAACLEIQPQSQLNLAVRTLANELAYG